MQIISQFKDFPVHKTGREIRELIKLRRNKAELGGSHSLDNSTNASLEVLFQSVSDQATYVLTLEQMQVLLGEVTS